MRMTSVYEPIHTPSGPLLNVVNEGQTSTHTYPHSFPRFSVYLRRTPLAALAATNTLPAVKDAGGRIVAMVRRITATLNTSTDTVDSYIFMKKRFYGASGMESGWNRLIRGVDVARGSVGGGRAVLSQGDGGGGGE